MRKARIYIAGPSVFDKNAKKIGKEYLAICQEYGFEGYYPLCEDIKGDEASPTSMKILLANLAKIDMADYMVADLNPFRGHCVDDGTAFEIGYAVHVGIPIFGFIDDDRSLRERIGVEDENGFLVEDFGLPCNLMIAESVVAIFKGDFRNCVRQLAENRHRFHGC